MATLSNRKGSRSIQFSFDGIRRQTITLGKVDKKTAETVRVHVARLVTAKATNSAMPGDTVLSLCDRTGNMVRPWADAGYPCVCVDMQHDGVTVDGNITFVGADVTDYLPPRGEYRIAFAFPPCTHLANSGNRWKADKGLDALIEALPIVRACRRILEWTDAPYMLENPVGSLSTYWRKPDHTCHPWHFGHPEQKLTCLWTGGGFVMPERTVHEKPADVQQSCWLAGPSEDRGDIRSVTPEAFARAVFEANECLHPLTSEGPSPCR